MGIEYGFLMLILLNKFAPLEGAVQTPISLQKMCIEFAPYLNQKGIFSVNC